MDLRSAKRQNNDEKYPLQRWGGRVSENNKGDEEDDKVHQHIPSLGGEQEPGAVEITFCPWNALCPLALQWNAPDHPEKNKNEVANTQGSNKDMAEAPIRLHHAHTDILKEDRQLEEEVD